MRRIGLAVVLAFSVVLAPLTNEAQPTGKVRRLGVLSAGTRQSTLAAQLLPPQLRELGYVEGQNLTIEWRFADGDAGRLPALAAELVRANVEIILANFMSEIQAARQATTSIPIVMVNSIDPVGNGLVASLGRPGGNLTGLTIQPPEFGGKLVELLKQAVPHLTGLAVIWDPSYPGVLPFYEHAEKAARTFGIKLQSFEVRQPSDIEAVLARITTERFQGLTVWPTSVISVNMRRILNFALEKRLPAIYPTSSFMDTGGLMSYGLSLDVEYRRIAAYIDRIFKGATPAELPVEQPTKYELIINLKEARAIGLTIPPLLLMRADRVIE